MSKDEGGRNSSFSEKPVRSRPRRLVDWINPTGAKKAHSLIDKVYKRKNLEMAWEKVKENRGSGGVDGQNLEAFEAQLDQQLDRLHQELKEDAYRPLPVRQHPIPKRDKPGEYRMLGIPAIYDRVCQQALLNRLEPIFEPVFDDASFGYRRGRSTKDALRKIWKEIQSGSEWIVDADLRDFFGSVDHEKLLTLVAQQVADGRVLRLIQAMLKAGSYGKGRLFPSERGTPQGGVVTPLTQKVISSSKGQSRVGEQGTRCLTFALIGNTFMTYGALDQSGKGSAAERRSWPTPASCRFAPSGTALVTRVRSVRTSSISVPGGSLPARSAGRSPRAYSADHVEASAEHGGTAAEAREKQWPDHGSDRDRRGERVSRCSKKAWLSRAPKAAHCKFTFPIRLIACSSQSSRKPTIFWSPRGSAPSAGV
jgi:Reverse transcriptase (RNA-dependent DNA polymerase)